jgi:UPF0755 protein
MKEKLKFWYEKSMRTAALIFLAAVCLFFYFVFAAGPPKNFPAGQTFSINEGQSLQEITDRLYDVGAIRSKFIFRSTVILLGGEKSVPAGDYLLGKPENALTLAWRFAFGKTDIALVKITIPEGWDIKQIADYLPTRLPSFDATEFQDIASSSEGYLFPDTYFVSPMISPKELMQKMENNFWQKIATVPQIKSFGKPLGDVVIMASILEDEAKTTADRQIVAGILWKRLANDMPLQVDCTVAYATCGGNLSQLTPTDLKINSPYNTYLHAGLPPTPVDNPGLDSLTAAVTPTATPYLYYLTDKNGVMHYATTFAEHQKNVAKYLK